MRSAQQGRFLGPVFSNFMVQTPSSPHNRNYLPKCFLTDFLPTMYGTYTPNLGPFGAGPDLVMHLPISDFSENCEPLYAPPAQFWTAAAFYKLPAATTHLHEQPVAAYVAAAAAYSPEASPQPPPAGSSSGAHAH
jgi:hypothetical protein